MTVECPTCLTDVDVDLSKLKADPTKVEEQLIELLNTLLITQRELIKMLQVMATPHIIYPQPNLIPTWEITNS